MTTTDLQLLDAGDVAAALKLTAEDVVRRTRRHNWPHVRLSQKTIRYTRDDLEQIVAKHHAQPDTGRTPPVVGLPGQTSRSKARAG